MGTYYDARAVRWYTWKPLTARSRRSAHSYEASPSPRSPTWCRMSRRSVHLAADMLRAGEARPCHPNRAARAVSAWKGEDAACARASAGDLLPRRARRAGRGAPARRPQARRSFTDTVTRIMADNQFGADPLRRRQGAPRRVRRAGTDRWLLMARDLPEATRPSWPRPTKSPGVLDEITQAEPSTARSNPNLASTPRHGARTPHAPPDRHAARRLRRECGTVPARPAGLQAEPGYAP